MKICPLGTELFHADGRTDTRNRRTDRHDVANRRNFSNAPKIFIERKYEGHSLIVGTGVRSRQLSWDNIVLVQNSTTKWT